MISAALLWSLRSASPWPAHNTWDVWNGARSSVSRAGDANGDGVPDILVSNSSVETPERVWVVSGKDGSALLEVRGRNPGDGFGCSMDRVGDVDGDGHGDFVVGACGEQMTKHGAYVRLHSGADGRVLQEFAPKTEGWHRGICVAGAGDVDRDGRPDVILGFPTGRAEVVIHSGRDGRLIHRFVNLLTSGTTVGGSGDLDGDGHDDVLIGDGTYSSEGLGRLRSLSGKTDEVLFTLMAEEKGESFPWAIASTGDMNSDRVPDILVSEESRFVRAISGKDGSTIHEWSSRGRRNIIDAFGASLDYLGDIDGDGVPDVIVGANESQAIVFDEGYATLYSGRSGRIIMEYELPDAGYDVSGLGDVDGDRVPDFVLCTPVRHQVQIVSGKTLGPIREIDWAKLKTPGTADVK